MSRRAVSTALSTAARGAEGAPVTRRAAPRANSTAGAAEGASVGGHIVWRGRPVEFRRGDTVALALVRDGVLDLGPAPAGGRFKLLCGIGQCQGCLVRHHGGGVREACLTPCADGDHWYACADAKAGH